MRETLVDAVTIFVTTTRSPAVEAPASDPVAGLDSRISTSRLFYGKKSLSATVETERAYEATRLQTALVRLDIRQLDFTIECLGLLKRHFQRK